MTAAVLFGAGASFACADVKPSRPPLGNELFLRICDSPPASLLPARIKKTFLKHGFEAGMYRVHSEAYEYVTPLQCQIAVYLLQLTPQSSTVYERFLRLLGPFARWIVWGTLNYDILLEQAAEAIFGSFDYGFSDTSLKPGIIKLHGSANFAVGGSEQLHNITIHVSGGASIAVGPLLPLHREEAIRRFTDPGESVGPVMSLYMPGKLDLASRSAIEPHRVTWYDALPKAMAVLIVGAAYNPEDSHIWKPILSSSARIGVVDPCAEAMVERIKADGHQNAYAVANAFDETALPRMKTFLQAP